MPDPIVNCPRCGNAKHPVSGSHYPHCGACPPPDPEVTEARRQRVTATISRIRENAGQYTNARFWHEPAAATDHGTPADIAAHAFMLSLEAQQAVPLPASRPTGKPGVFRPVYRLPNGREIVANNIAIMLGAMDYLMLDRADADLINRILRDQDPANDDPVVAVAMLEHYRDTGICNWRRARQTARDNGT